MTVRESLRGVPLSPREVEVVQLVARGMTNTEIGAELGLAPNTVKAHMARIGMKLGVGDRAGIVGAAIRSGRLKIPPSGQVPEGFDEALFNVLVRIARGMSNQEIGLELNLSFDAVKGRVRRLLLVFGVRGREEAVAVGVACGALRLVPVQRQIPAQRRERVAA